MREGNDSSREESAATRHRVGDGTVLCSLQRRARSALPLPSACEENKAQPTKKIDMPSAYAHDLVEGVPIASPVHRAAMAGDYDTLSAILCELDENKRSLPVDEPDAEGKSAMFYAQICGHEAIIELLSSRGWTKMPAGNIFTSGPSGRNMFWEYDGRVSSAARPFHATSRKSPAAMSFMRYDRPLAMKTATKKSSIVQLRRLLRRHPRSQMSLSGPDHWLYSRKVAGGLAEGAQTEKEKRRRPTLNVRDWATGFKQYNQLVQAGNAALAGQVAEAAVGTGSEYDEDSDEEEEVRGMASPAHECRTLAKVARFVINRKPVRNAEGTAWIVIEPVCPEDEEAYIPSAPYDEVLSIASESYDDVLSVASEDDGCDIWTSEEAGEPLAPVGEEEEEKEEEEEEGALPRLWPAGESLWPALPQRDVKPRHHDVKTGIIDGDGARHDETEWEILGDENAVGDIEPKVAPAKLASIPLKHAWQCPKLTLVAIGVA